MSSILRLWAIFVVTIKRVLTQRGLALATSLGLVAAVALTMSIPIYADAVYQNILKREVADSSPGEGKQATRPPFAFMFRYVGSWSGPVQWDKIKPLDNYMSGPVTASLGLPQKLFVRYFKTESLQLFAHEKSASYKDTETPLEWVSFATLSDLDKHISLLEGNYPITTTSSADTLNEVLVNEAMATKLGLQAGETYVTYGEITTDQGSASVQIPLRIAGVWKATDPTEAYWFYSPSEYETTLLVPEATFANRITPGLKGNVYLALWYMVMDGSRVHSNDVPSLLGRIGYVQQYAYNLLNKTRMDISPVEILTNYQRAAGSLTIYLYSLSIPILSMILTFVGLVGEMSVGQRRNEIAVLRSRGATLLQVLGMAVLEGLLLGAVGMIVGAPTSQAVAQFFGKARSFLDFTAQSHLKADLTTVALRFGLITAGIGLIAILLPTLSAARHTIVTYKQERARQLRPAWWQRVWMDVILLVPAVYGAYLLRRQGGMVLPVKGVSLSNDPFQNPLLLLVPALGIFALTLFLLRILPFLMSAVAWLAARTKSVGVLLATRHLSRTSGMYSAPLILLIVTLSLSTFTASLAQTLDRHLHDQTYYHIGADMSVVELGDTQGGLLSLGGQSSSAGQQGQDIRWFFLPVTEHLKVPGVTAAARIEHSPISIVLSGGTVNANYYGIDRVDFPRVAFWRKDFASVSLGTLMNYLALTTEGVLVSRDFMVTNGLKPGDTLQVSVYNNGTSTNMGLKIVGAFNLFPSWYPEDGPLLVGNLDYFFEQMGGEQPYDVWLRTNPNADYPKLIEGVRELYLRLLNYDISPLELVQEQSRPERQGLFGLLSVGFMALALLTVLGFLLYALFSFRRRFIELGMLRAIGLSAGQMMVFLASELAFLLLIGIAAGTGLGVWVSNLFIPYLQVGTDVTSRIPPFLVQIDWLSIFRIYILFGLLFVIALGALAALLLRMKIFQAVKLGEAA